MTTVVMVQHVAIIPDGNRRWAKAKGKPSVEGHRYAVEHTLPALFDVLQELEIKYCTIWLLSPENFTKRTPSEVKNLLFLLKWFLHKRIDEFERKGVLLKVIGDIHGLPQDMQQELQKAVDKTSHNAKTIVTFAINYGGKDEMIRAMRKMTEAQLPSSDITRETFERYLDTIDMPEPDLIIRTGGETRTSGFMLWQSEYTEYCFTETLFPDFSPQELAKCLEDYRSRKRRFGK